MPNENQTLTFKLVIDGKESVGTIQLTKREVEDLNTSINKIQDRPILKQFARDLLLVNASAEEATTGIMDFIKWNEMTEPEIQSVINTLREEQRVLAVGSAQWQYHGQAIDNMSNAYLRMQAQQRAFTGSSNAARMAVGQFGFALGDASMIAVDFRMFLMSIGNNIPFIVQGLAQVSQEAKTANMSFGAFLKNNLDASMKLVLGANALMFAVQVLPVVYKLVENAIGKTDDKIKELNKTMGEEEKKVRVQHLEYTSLLGVLGDINSSTEARKGALESLQEKYPEYIKNLESEKSSTEQIAAALKLGNEQFEKKIQLAASERILKEYYDQAAQSEYDIQKLQESRKDIQKQFDEGNKSRGFSLQQIDADVKKLDERKNAAVNKINEFNTAISKLNAGIIDKGKGGGSGSGSNKNGDKDPIKKLVDEYNTKKELNELTNQSNQENINSTRLLVNEELKNNLTLEQQIALRKLLLQLNDDEFGWEKDRWKSADAKPDSSKEYDEAQKKLKKLQEQSVIDSKTNIWEKEKAIDEQKQKEEIDFYERAYKDGLITLEDYLKAKDLIEEQYDRKSRQRDREAFLYKINTIAELSSTITSAYNQIYDAIESNVSEEISTWKDKEDKKIDIEREAALKHARTQAQRERINEQFDKRRDQLEDEAQKKSRERLAAWFYINKAVSATNAVIASIAAGLNTMKQMSEYLPPPFPQIAMGVTIAAGLAQAAVITQQKLPGYKKGGAIVGEEGPEIIAPFQDYASGQSKLIAMTMMTLRDELRSSRSSSGVSLGLNDDSIAINKELRDILRSIKNNGIKARAYLSDRDAREIESRGSALNRRNKL